MGVVLPSDLTLTMRRVLAAPPERPQEGRFGTKDRLWNDRRLVSQWREAWATLVNERLAEAGLEARVDHRALTERGIVRKSQRMIGATETRRARRVESSR
jgi:hypothetical protein